jgi:ubiquinone/menaquinone biosynthesis C-methylase UbiE
MRKRESYDLLAAAPGSTILEVGCGLGDDAAALARRVAPGGSVVAVDGSETMVDAARRRHGDVAGLSFDIADATRLPFGDATFDGCRIDRVLQHVGDPAAAVRDMATGVAPRRCPGRIRQRLGDADDRLGGQGADAHRPECLV